MVPLRCRVERTDAGERAGVTSYQRRYRPLRRARLKACTASTIALA